jgi:hypothetical protein
MGSVYLTGILEWPEKSIMVGATRFLYVEIEGLGAETVENAVFSVEIDGAETQAEAPATVEGNKVGGLVEVSAAGDVDVFIEFDLGDETLMYKVTTKGVE